MAIIRIDDGLQKLVEKEIKKDKIEYPSIKNFVDKAIREKLTKK